MTPGIDRSRLKALLDAENRTFAARTTKSAAMRARALHCLPNAVPMQWMTALYRTPPIYVAGGNGSIFTDIDGNSYCDFNVCDLSMTMGYGPTPIVAAVGNQIAIGAHYLLATEAAVDVAENLAARCGLPFWQFTTTASTANIEVMRVARTLTGRRKVVVFDGHYHGHIDETLVYDANGQTMPSQLGLTPGAIDHTVIVPFNDLAALEAALDGDDVALVLTEPALTNTLLVLPDPGYLSEVRRLTAAHGTYLCIDEAHTFQFAYGGLTRKWSLDCDFIVLGKGFGTGISFALYGMSAAIGKQYAELLDEEGRPKGLATGGTTYASALAAVAAKAALEQVLTPEGYATLHANGAYLADGLDAIFSRRELAWRAFRLGPRTGYCLRPDLPRNGQEAALSIDNDLIAARRVYMANRGVWEAIWSAGTQVSFAHAQPDLDRYLELADAFLGEIQQ
jgi:glutamate-1-semialdehyde 2,1-aminomutase